jgi:hypothetical protein
MVPLVTDKPDPSTEPHISSHELQRLLAMIVTRNPKAICLLMEVGDDMLCVSTPDIWTLQKGMVSAVYEAFTAASE